MKDIITQEDRLKTEIKFLQWDKLRDKELTPKDLNLLYDPTIFAYAFLTNTQNKPLKLFPYQDMIINDRSRFVQWAAANQIGKTLTLAVKGIHHALMVNNACVLVMANKYELSKKVLNDMRDLLARAKFPVEEGEKDNVTTLEIKNFDKRGSSRIIAVPPTEAALSYTVTLSLDDEVGFWENSQKLYNTIVETRTNMTKNWKNPNFTMGQIVLVSNPNRRQGIFYKIWAEDSRYSKYRFNFLDCPMNTKAEWDSARSRLTIDEFDSTYAAVFTSAEGSFITETEFNAAVSEEPIGLDAFSNIYLGLDKAGTDVSSRNTDSSALCGFSVYKNDKGENCTKMRYYKVFPPNTPSKEIYSEILRLFKNYSVSGIAYDKVGVGDSVRGALIDIGIPDSKIYPLTYSLPNKTDVYQNLKLLYEQRRIQHPDIQELRNELLHLEVTRQEGSNYIKVHHESREFHDDIADSCANSCYLALRLTTPSVSVTFV